jgi:hypothetical protein
MFNVTMKSCDLTLHTLRSMQGISCEQLLADLPQNYQLMRFKSGAAVKNATNDQISFGACPEMALRLALVADKEFSVDVKHLPVTLALIDQFRQQLSRGLEPVEVFVSLKGEFFIIGLSDREFGSRLKRAFPQIKLRNEGYYNMAVAHWASQFEPDLDSALDSEEAPE